MTEQVDHNPPQWSVKQSFKAWCGGDKWAALLFLPSTLGVARNVVLEAVLFDLQRVLEGAVQLLHRHLDGALRHNTVSVENVILSHEKRNEYIHSQLFGIQEKKTLRVCAAFRRMNSEFPEPNSKRLLLFSLSFFFLSTWTLTGARWFSPRHLKAHHIFLGSRWCVVLTDLQFQHIPLPVEGKAAKELHHGALVSGHETLKTQSRCR